MKGIEMNEYSWRIGDSLCNNALPNLPSRVALTATGVITRQERGGAKSLLLCNPHPDSWNSWMLPYGSLALDIGELPTQTSFGELTETMESLRRQNADMYESKALAQVRDMVGLPTGEFHIEPRISNYSLKFSKSANVWTCYCFTYHICRAGENAQPNVKAEWLMLNDQEVSTVLSSKKLAGLVVADNVALLLKEREAMKLLS